MRVRLAERWRTRWLPLVGDETFAISSTRGHKCCC